MKTALTRTIRLHKRRADLGNIYMKGGVVIKQHCMERDDYAKEFNILSAISHANIISPQKNYIENNKFCVEYKYYSEGDLHSWIHSKHPQEAKDSFYWVAEQTATSIGHLHDLNMVHLDIKPENFLMEGNSITLIDFETVEQFSGSNPYSLVHGFSKKGTSKYMAPEMMQNCDYSKMTDIYSLGRMFYLMICYRLPDRTEPDLSTVMKAYPEFADCLSNMLQPNHTFRPEIKDVINIIRYCKKLKNRD